MGMQGDAGRRGRIVGRTGVAGFSIIRHQIVLVQLAGLVVGRLEDGCTAHGGL